MARGQAKSNVENSLRQPPVFKDQRKRPRGIKKQQAVRKSARLQAIENLRKQYTSKSHNIQEVQVPLSPPASSIPNGRKAPQPPQILPKPPTSSRKRKRGQEEQGAGHLSSRIRRQPPSKRPQISPPSCTAEVGLKTEKEKKEKASDIIKETADPLEYWTLTNRWPKEYFEQDSQTREDLEQTSSLEDQMGIPVQTVKYVEIDGFRLPCPIRRALTSLSRKQSDSSLNGSGNREGKSAKYQNPGYTLLLERTGSYMRAFSLGVTTASLTRCKTLLDLEQTVPKDSMFQDDIFKATCNKVQDRNEARVIRSITPCIVPSVEDLETLGATHLEHLIEGVNECWTGNIAVEGPLPKPDYSVGFRRSAFTREQLKKLDMLVGGIFENSFFAANYRMYFPFFTCEVKCGSASLDIADRQNAHSMTVAARAFVELFRTVKREKELNREILAFSVSHDHRSVRIYGHYPVIEGNETTFFRHPIREFSFVEQDGKEKWTTYKFVKNVYDHHSLKNYKLICSAIDDLPDGINFDLSQSASFPPSTPQSSQQSNAESISGDDDSQSSFLVSQEVTPTTSFAQATEPVFKKPRNKRACERQR
ncbi:hypothetical protein MMC17_010132 [Xylographa soralifera]|nr:hypothetical protein [Xylographa soralifera]